MDIIELELENRKDFLSVDKLTAISSEGEIFNVGDNVKHEGDDEEKIGIISHFTLNEGSMDVVAHTEHGFGSISFLYK
jgi:NADH dehydrogenase FAD-containing subunit